MRLFFVLFSYVQHGGGEKGMNFIMNEVKEFFILITHSWPLVLLLLNLLMLM